jgi:hypothetical protein
MATEHPVHERVEFFGVRQHVHSADRDDQDHERVSRIADDSPGIWRQAQYQALFALNGLHRLTALSDSNLIFTSTGFSSANRKFAAHLAQTFGANEPDLTLVEAFLNSAVLAPFGSPWRSSKNPW